MRQQDEEGCFALCLQENVVNLSLSDRQEQSGKQVDERCVERCAMGREEKKHNKRVYVNVDNEAYCERTLLS